MAASFSLPTVLANLAAGNQALSLIDGDLTTLRDPLLSLNTFSNYYTDVGTANAYAITVSAPQTVAQSAGLPIQFLATNANTGASTLQVNALAVKNIVRIDGSALVAGDIPAAGLVTVIYDGTSYQLQSRGKAISVLRSYLAGLTLSTAGASTTMTIAAGQAAESANAVLMTLASSIGKTTSAWAVGTGNGGIDTGAIANSTWYHFYLIMRPDTSVVDVVFSTNATTPTLPTNYTLYRRVGSGLTNGSAQWTKFIQDGELFELDIPVADISATNPGTSAVSATLTVPLGVNVIAWVLAAVNNVSTTNMTLLLSDPAVTDTTPSFANGFFSLITEDAGATRATSADFHIRTNTSKQIRYRINASGASDVIKITTKGWIDRRGRDS